MIKIVRSDENELENMNYADNGEVFAEEENEDVAEYNSSLETEIKNAYLSAELVFEEENLP